LETDSLLRIVTAGSVDDGKSTLIGRLLFDTLSLPDDQIASVRKASGQHLDLSYFTDGLKAEREQKITIDVAYRYFSTPRRKFILADAPGHEQYTRNLATAASLAQAGILLVDVEKGLTEQTKRHAFILSLLGVKALLLAVNKMDRVAFAEAPFRRTVEAFLAFSSQLKFSEAHYLPISALEGDNVTSRSSRLPWYHGPHLLELISTVANPEEPVASKFRFPVQRVLCPSASLRAIAGTVASGVVRVGDRVKHLPSGLVTRVREIQLPSGRNEIAVPDQAISVVLENELDIKRGDWLVHESGAPVGTRQLETTVVWMASTALVVGRRYRIKHGALWTRARPVEILHGFDLNTLNLKKTQGLGLNEIGRVLWECDETVYPDPYEENRVTGALIVVDPETNLTVGAMMVAPSKTKVRPNQPRTYWLTGLPSAGKTTLADGAAAFVKERGQLATVLDGDRLRTGLCSGLGFSESDRKENCRRVAEAAKLLNDAGITVFVALISPFAADRARAREIVGESFIEVFLDTPLEVCERRDPKGHYRKARLGELPQFTGISSPYERPLTPEVILTSELPMETSIQILLDSPAVQR